MSGKCCKKKGKKSRKHTDIKSKKEFRAMAAARAAQEGKIPLSELYGASKEMYKSMKKSGPKSPKAHMEEVAGKSLPETANSKYVAERKGEKRRKARA